MDSVMKELRGGEQCPARSFGLEPPLQFDNVSVDFLAIFLLRMRRNGHFRASGYNSTTPLDSATQISYWTGIFRQTECIFSSLFCILSPKMRHISTSGLLDLLS